MTRRKVKEILERQLKELQKAHVAELMKDRQDKKLEEILTTEVEKMDFSVIEIFEQPVYRTLQEIPKEFVYELVCYINKSGLPDSYFFADDFNFISILQRKEERVAGVIASLMAEGDLSSYTIKDLLWL